LPKAKMVSDPNFRAVIMPLYGRLSPTEQRRIFQPVKGRKIVIATNVAETSITVPGIRYVVDTGLARIAAYNPRARTYKLPVVPIARSACDQRAGRCGRVGPGICIRLYPEEDYLNRPLYTPPEIVRSNLAEVILRMTALQLGDPAAFPFVDPPSARAIRDGYQLLAELGALEPTAPGSTAPARLSRQGRLMARLPLDPCISRMILEARDHNALREVCIIAAALSIQDPRVRPADKEKEADQAHQRFASAQSDFLFYLKLWETSRAVLAQTGSQGKLRKFCASHFLSYQRMREWQDIHDQILRILADERGFSFNEVPAQAAAIHQALLSGNLRNIALKKEKNRYQGGGGREVMIFPGSLLYAAQKQEFAGGTEPTRETKTATTHQGHAGVSGRGMPQVAASGAALRAPARKPARSPQDAVPRGRLPQWIMAAELVETTKLYARTVAAIEPEWIEPLARPLMRYSYSDPHWEKRRGQVVATERGTLFGLPVVTGRKIPYARVDREDARRLFIQSALVEGELRGGYPFLDHNREAIARLQDLEERSRRRDLLVGDEEIYQFYDRQLPAEVFDQAGLNRLLKTKRGDDFLRLREQDLISREPEPDLAEKFPATLQVGELSLALSYHFEPGSEDDGLSIMIPVALAPHLRPEFFEWLVPGMLEEKIFFLLKNLPKSLRRHLVPIPQTAADLARALKPGNVSLYQSLSRAIYEMFSQRIPGSAWAIADLPLHLRCRFCLVDEQGKIVAAGRDLGALVSRGESRRAELPEAAVNALRQQWEREKISAEQLPNIPERLPVAGADGQLTGYLFPGLEESGEQVNLRLFTDQEAARAATRQGLLRLYRREFSAGLKMLRKELVFPRQHWRLAQGLTGLDELNRQMVEFVLREIFATDEGRIPSPEEFQTTVERVRAQGLFAEARRLYALILEVLNERWEVLNTLNRLHPTTQPAGQGSAAASGLAAELQRQLTALVPPDFLARHDAAGLARLPRYLKALRIRSERAHAVPAKDAAKAAQLAPFQDRLAQYPQPAQLSPNKKALLAEYRLMLEEYKVSLFAQELKTRFPVSPQRLEEKWREVEEAV
jgi:ATP-dependent helicase HrpA